MKLAEALAERSDCQVRLEELKKRLLRNARVQEGDTATEDPTALMSELDRTFLRLTDLVSAINRTNARTAFDAELSLSDAIARRDLTAKRRDILTALAEAASTRQDRYSKSEVKFVATVPIAEVQRQIDLLSKLYRETDTRLQELNWRTELI